MARMKRVTHAGGSIVTGSAVADALLDYATQMERWAKSVAVDIPVLEDDGEVTVHTILLGSASALVTSEIDGPADVSVDGTEEERFPVPEFPALATVAVPVPQAEAETSTEELSDVIAAIEADLESEEGFDPQPQP